MNLVVQGGSYRERTYRQLVPGMQGPLLIVGTDHIILTPRAGKKRNLIQRAHLIVVPNF